MTDRTASPTTVAFRNLPADIQATSFDAVGHLPRPMSHMEMLLAVGQAILAERERDKWQPIASAPKNGTRILAVHENGSDIQITWFGKTSHVPLYGWCEGEDAEDIDLWHPTHWQPLPEAPK